MRPISEDGEILLWLFFYSSAKWGGMVYPYILSQKQLKMSCWAAHWAAILEFLHKQLTFWAAPLNNNEMIIITQHWVILNELVWTWMNLFQPVYFCNILLYFCYILLYFVIFVIFCTIFVKINVGSMEFWNGGWWWNEELVVGGGMWPLQEVELVVGGAIHSPLL